MTVSGASVIWLYMCGCSWHEVADNASLIVLLLLLPVLLQWYLALWRSPSFRAQAQARYQQLRNSSWSDSWYTIDTQVARINAATARNFARWGATFAADKVQFTPGLQGVAAWNASVVDLRTWIVARLHWLDAALAKRHQQLLQMQTLLLVLLLQSSQRLHQQ